MNSFETSVTGQESESSARHLTMEQKESFIISPNDPILVTGAAGFIGSRVVEGLLDRGFRNLISFARPSSQLGP